LTYRLLYHQNLLQILVILEEQKVLVGNLEGSAFQLDLCLLGSEGLLVESQFLQEW